MALLKANEVLEKDLEKVAGGTLFDNVTLAGQGKVRVGMNNFGFAYTYDVSRQQDVENALANVDYTGCKTVDDIERARLERLKSIPGLLTAIPGCDKSWY